MLVSSERNLTGAVSSESNISPATSDTTFFPVPGDGIVVYGENGITTPRFRFWDDTAKDFEDELSALDIGENIRWVVLRASPVRNEVVAGTIDQANDINVQFFNGTNSSWYNLNELTATTNGVNEPQLAIAYEQVSGDALIVYEESSTNDYLVGFRTWNGALSAESLLSTGLFGAVHWIKAVPRPTTDEIMVLMMNENSNLFAILWNGTGFESVANITLSVATKTQDNFDFAWESTGDEGIVVFGEDTSPGNDVYKYKRFDDAAKNWSATEIFLEQNDGDSSVVRLCSDPTSSYIGFIGQDSKNDVNARIWNGTGIEAFPIPPTEDETTVAHNLAGSNVDCAWESDGSEAVFGFADVDHETQIAYVTYDEMLWSVASLEDAEVSPNIAAGDIEGLRFTPKPIGNEIMAIVLDLKENASAARWNGFEFVLPATSLLESSTECLNGNTECAQFVWLLFGIGPNLVVTKTDDPDPVSPGEILSYTIMITNNGTDTAFNVTLTEFYPSTVLFINASPVPSSGNDTWYLGNLTPGSATSVNISVLVTSSANGTILNNTVIVNYTNSKMQSFTVTADQFTVDPDALMLLMPKDTINCTATVFQDFDSVTLYTCGDNASIGGSIECDSNGTASSATLPTNATTCDVNASNFGAFLLINNGSNATLNATLVNVTVGGVMDFNISIDNYIFDAVSTPGCNGTGCNNCPAADTPGCFKDIDNTSATPDSVLECDNFVAGGALCECFSIHISNPDTVHAMKNGKQIQFKVKKAVASPASDPCP